MGNRSLNKTLKKNPINSCEWFIISFLLHIIPISKLSAIHSLAAAVKVSIPTYCCVPNV